MPVLSTGGGVLPALALPRRQIARRSLIFLSGFFAVLAAVPDAGKPGSELSDKEPPPGELGVDKNLKVLGCVPIPG